MIPEELHGMELELKVVVRALKGAIASMTRRRILAHGIMNT